MSFKAGEYQALGVSIGHRFTPSGSPITQLQMLLGRFWDGGQWVRLPEPVPFTGEWFLYKANGDPSDHRQAMFRNVLGWDGVDLETLQNLDISKKYFNVTLAAQKDTPQYVEATFINPLGNPHARAKKIEKAPADVLKKFSARGVASTPGGAFAPASAPQKDEVPF